jgi:hypothetical protein
MSAFDVLSQARKRGLTLTTNGDRLEVSPAYDCPRELVRTLQEYKPALVSLLASKERTWIEFYSERLGETVFFCEDEETCDALIRAGASEWSIYTKAELRTLCAQNRVAPLSDAELRKVHELKRTFDARIAE